MLPARYAPIAFGFILSGLMSLMVSGISTLKSLGLIDGFAGLWLSNWVLCWAAAFPTAVLAAPVARRLVEGIVIRRART